MADKPTPFAHFGTLAVHAGQDPKQLWTSRSVVQYFIAMMSCTQATRPYSNTLLTAIIIIHA